MGSENKLQRQKGPRSFGETEKQGKWAWGEGMEQDVGMVLCLEAIYLEVSEGGSQ